MGWAIFAPLWTDTLTTNMLEIWQPVCCIFGTESVVIPCTVLLGLARTLGIQVDTKLPGVHRAQPEEVAGPIEVTPPIRAIGPSSTELAQAEGLAIIRVFSCVHRSKSMGSLEAIVAACAEQRETFLERPLLTVSAGQGNITDTRSHLIPSEQPLMLPINMQGSDAQVAACVPDRGSVMACADIASAARACMGNKVAITGLIAQQCMPMLFGGTNHAEAAHSRLSAALGPSSSLCISKAEQRLELHAIHHNQKKATLHLANTTNKRSRAQRAELLRLSQLNVATVVGATFDSHPLCSGPIFTAIMSCNTFKAKTAEELRNAGMQLEKTQKVKMTETLRRNVLCELLKAVDDEAAGSSKYSLKSLTSRIRTAVDVPGLSREQIRRIAESSADELIQGFYGYSPTTVDDGSAEA
jgi:hypothetical protein